MSQGDRSNASGFTAVGEFAEWETVEYVFDDRRRTGGHREYLCRVGDFEEPRWLKATDVSGECLAVWEAGEAARIDKRDYERSSQHQQECTQAAAGRRGEQLCADLPRLRGGQDAALAEAQCAE